MFMRTEIEERRRKQTIRVVIAEVCMLAAIIILVIFLVMLALGYNFNLGGEMETSGLVQINSLPTGAAITVDGEGMFLPTNQSKTMTSGEHNIALHKDGFTSWEKTINVREGMLYRLYYPRLYLTEREKEIVLDSSEETRTLASVSVSKDYKYILYIYDNSAEWALAPINDSEPKLKKLDVSTVLGATDGVYGGRVEIVEWARNSSKVLAKACGAESCDWLLVNLSDTEKSLNLTREFAISFDKITIASDSADVLLSLAQGSLRQINVSDVEISKVMASNVVDYSNHGADFIYLSQPEVNKETEVAEQNVYSYNDEKPVKIFSREQSEAPLLILLSAYYSDDYFSVVSGQEMKTYYGKLPEYNEEFEKTMKELASATLEFNPEKLEVRGGGELVVVAAGAACAVMDAESYEISSYTAESAPKWLSEFDIYTVRDTWLTAWDFDNSNPRALISDFAEDKPVVISENDRYLYYFDKDLNLVRENIK